MKRRNLLASGILIATLPDGAALAAASSAQCLVADSQRQFDPAVLRDPLAPWEPADDALRVTGKVYEWGNRLVYNLGGPGNYYSDGSDAPRIPPGVEGKPVDLLVYFGANDDWTQVARIGPYPLVQPADGFQGISPSCMVSVSTKP